MQVDLDLGLVLALKWYRSPTLSLSTIYFEVVFNPKHGSTLYHHLFLIEDTEFWRPGILFISVGEGG